LPPTRREQLNVPVSERLALTARQVCLARGVTVPELLRPVVEKYLQDELDTHSNIRSAVEAIEAERTKERGGKVSDLRAGSRTTGPVSDADRGT